MFRAEEMDRTLVMGAEDVVIRLAELEGSEAHTWQREGA